MNSDSIQDAQENIAKLQSARWMTLSGCCKWRSALRRRHSGRTKPRKRTPRSCGQSPLLLSP